MTQPLAEHIRTTDYVRQRLTPLPGDETYLHLADLRLSLDRVATKKPIDLLDYGCGGSPYRGLFPNAVYRRADFLESAGDPLDYRLDMESRVAADDASFDFILSTQVLEHVAHPAIYLSECFRLLRPGGQLFITTHGFYPDHGCPYDFRRWTADGLVLDLKAAGFAITTVEKQTTGPRCALFVLELECAAMTASRRTPFGLGLLVFRKLFMTSRPWLHKMADVHFARHRVATENLESHRNYVVVACLAKRP